MGSVPKTITSDHLGSDMDPADAETVRVMIERRTAAVELRHELLDMLGLEES